MNRPLIRCLLASTVLIALAVSPLCWAKGSVDNRYKQHNLVTDDTSKIPADNQDTTLLNPWGVAFFLVDRFG
jgi:hypothetical protein